jgi:aconitate hydratase
MKNKPLSLAEKIIAAHLVDGEMEPGREIAIRADQWLSHDMNAPMGFLAFETLDIPRIKIGLGVVYADHNLVQVDFKTPDDFAYVRSAARKYGIHFSRPGNGICHITHTHRFAVPGQVLIGSDSHTPMSSSVGMLAIGVGGLDGALALAGEPYYFRMPRVMGVRLTGRRRAGVGSKDVMLELLRRLSVKGGVGYILEYFGPGVADLDVSERATLTNMGTETGATASIFPSDEITRKFLRAQRREEDWSERRADDGVAYDSFLEIELSELEPLVARPHMPDNVVKVRDLPRTPVSQVVVGSCTNASYADIAKVAAILEGRVVAPGCSLSVVVGTRAVYEMLVRDGHFQKLIASGARVLEVACGPCNGVGQAPGTGSVSLRTQNRNFRGRSGTVDAEIYLCGPEVAAASAVLGYIAAPGEVMDPAPLLGIKDPEEYVTDDRMIEPPLPGGAGAEIERGPNIKPMPVNEPLPSLVSAVVAIKLPDNVTTDDIVPAGTTLSNLRSNVPALSEHLFERVDKGFVSRMREAADSGLGGVIVAGENYGQGSSREHAALCPMYAGVKAVLVKSLARIHRDNLINYGVLPLTFEDKADYGRIAQGDAVELPDLPEGVRSGRVVVRLGENGEGIAAVLDLSEREKAIILAGGKLTYVRDKNRSAKKS